MTDAESNISDAKSTISKLSDLFPAKIMTKCQAVS